MHRKKERLIWIVSTSVLAVILSALLLAPIALAQSERAISGPGSLEELESALYLIQNSYVDDVDFSVLIKGAVDGLFSSLDDPYSLYLDGKDLEQLSDITDGKYGGVGLYIVKERYDPENPTGRLPFVKVVAPIEDTPGWRGGINAGDYIYAIDDVSAEGYSTQEVSSRLRGIPGTSVLVTLLRNDSFTFNVTLVREEIEIPTVKSTVINDRWGYLRIIEFTPFTVPRVEETLTQFNTLNIDGMIVDVRNNPGGLLDAVIDVGDLFFSGGILVKTQYRHSSQDAVHRANIGKIVPSTRPIAVLIDKGSASASEILAGALQDRGRATVFGETSFGKGSIQQIFPLGENAVKLTTGRYLTPSGTNIDKTGIVPDVEISTPELTEEQSQAYALLLQENRVELFVNEHPQPEERHIAPFIEALKKEGVDPGERVIRTMIKSEVVRRMNSPPVVDLEFDTVLIRALEHLELQN